MPSWSVRSSLRSPTTPKRIAFSGFPKARRMPPTSTRWPKHFAISLSGRSRRLFPIHPINRTPIDSKQQEINMHSTRAFLPLKTWAGLALTAAFCPGLAMAESAGTYPDKRLEVILPYAAGGGVDAMARAFSEEASKLTQQQWVVVNRPGGGGTVGFSALAHAQPNGYTVVFSPASALTNAPFLISKMPFEAEQIEPVCQIFENVFALAVTPDSPISSLEDLIEKAKADPGAVSYGHAGPGSVPHLSVAAIEKAHGITLNGIGYRGDGQMLPDLMGGHVDFGAPAIPSLGGKNMRVLAVLSDKRHPAL